MSQRPIGAHARITGGLATGGLRYAAAVGYSLRRAREIGARGVVVHTGSAVAGDKDAALHRVCECLLPLLDAIGDDGPDLLLEPMAGQGQMLCAALPDLEPYLDALDWHPRAAVCLDTCHAFAAGHDLRRPHGAAAALHARNDAGLADHSGGPSPGCS